MADIEETLLAAGKKAHKASPDEWKKTQDMSQEEMSDVASSMGLSHKQIMDIEPRKGPRTAVEAA